MATLQITFRHQTPASLGSIVLLSGREARIRARAGDPHSRSVFLRIALEARRTLRKQVGTGIRVAQVPHNQRYDFTHVLHGQGGMRGAQ